MAVDKKRLLSVSEAAKELGVDKKTLRAWADKGFVEHIKTPTGWRLFERNVIAQLIADMRVGTEGKAAA